MKNIIILAILSLVHFGCEKETEFTVGVFPGFTGKNGDATWVVYSHNITDPTYLSKALPNQTPATTLANYDAAFKASYGKEASGFSYRFYQNGDIAVVKINAQSQNVWIKQTDLKWETEGDQLIAYRITANGRSQIFTGFKDQARLLIKFTKAFYGDNTTDKAKVVLEAYYNFNN